MKKMIGLLALAAIAGTAAASTSTTVPGTVIGSVTFNNVSGAAAIGNANNSTGSWVATGSGSVVGVRVTGSLTEVNLGTFASEARVNFTGLFGARAYRASTTGGFTGTLPIGPTFHASTSTAFTPATAFDLTAGETVGFEWFESFDDGSDGMIDSTWGTVTYDFLSSVDTTTITNGNFNAGAIGFGGSYTTPGSHVSGGIDFFAFSIPAVANPGEMLSIRMTAGTTGTSMTDTEIALYDGAGNLVANNDDFTGLGLFSGLDLTTLAGGNYTLVTGGFNTTFPATLGGTFIPGTNAGTYDLSIQLIPAPGALALVGMGGLVATRRRRA